MLATGIKCVCLWARQKWGFNLCHGLWNLAVIFQLLQHVRKRVPLSTCRGFFVHHWVTSSQWSIFGVCRKRFKVGTSQQLLNSLLVSGSFSLHMSPLTGGPSSSGVARGGRASQMYTAPPRFSYATAFQTDSEPAGCLILHQSLSLPTQVQALLWVVRNVLPSLLKWTVWLGSCRH